MGMRAIIWALSQDVDAVSKLVLVKLADNASDEHGVCWPSYDYLARELRMSRQAVIRHVAKLVEGGVIRKSVGGGRGRVNHYQLPDEALAPKGSHVATVSPVNGNALRLEPKPTQKVSGFGVRSESLNQPSERAAQNGNGAYSARDAVSYFVDRNNERGIFFASSVKGQVARASKSLIDDGIARDLLERAIDLMIEKGLNPATLPSLVGTVQARPRRQTGADVIRMLEEGE